MDYGKIDTNSLLNVGWERFMITAFRDPVTCIGEWLIAAKNRGDHWVDLVVYEVVACDMESGFCLFERDGSSSSSDMTQKPAAAAKVIEGFVKWDGDAQWDFPNGFCFVGYEGAYKSGRLIKSIMDFAASMMPNAADFGRDLSLGRGPV
jgi:hypothetical protein